jgi:catechol 2,3-dioxygenase-like lactoylglutathione lyase family enzyme
MSGFYNVLRKSHLHLWVINSKAMRAISIFSVLTLIYMSSPAQNNRTAVTEYQDVYSIYITKDLKASKDFYVKWLDFEVVFEASWFVYMQTKGDRKFSFALIDETHPSTPPSYGAFNGLGSFLTLQVEDAPSVYEKLKKMQAPISYPLKKEDWGQIRFGLTDPNGLYIDIVQQIDPVAGYWEKYPAKD